MRVTMQEDVHLLWRPVRRNMHKPEPQCAPDDVLRERPLQMAVAISADHEHGRTDSAQGFEEIRRANVAEVPDFIRVARELENDVR